MLSAQCEYNVILANNTIHTDNAIFANIKHAGPIANLFPQSQWSQGKPIKIIIIWNVTECWIVNNSSIYTDNKLFIYSISDKGSPFSRVSFVITGAKDSHA